MRLSYVTAVIGAGMAFAFPADDFRAAAASTCSAASSVVSAVSSCGGTKYCSSYLTPVTTTVTSTTAAAYVTGIRSLLLLCSKSVNSQILQNFNHNED